MGTYITNNDVFFVFIGYNLDGKLLNDKVYLKNVLQEMPRLIGMNPITEPIISIANNNPGLEGYVPIDESNITISTYTENPRLIVCIHSCKEFVYQKVLQYLKEKYKVGNTKVLYCLGSDIEEDKND